MTRDRSWPVSIQNFGSFAANFHPHVHALVTEGACHVDASSRHAEFERVPWWDRHALSEVFRRLVLRELRRTGRLREETESMLLSWQHSGFHVHAGEPPPDPQTGSQRLELDVLAMI